MLDDQIMHWVRDEGREFLDEVVETLPRQPSLEAQHLEVARVLDMRPIDKGARRIRAVHQRDAGTGILTELRYRYRIWKRKIVARERARAGREYEERASRLEPSWERSNGAGDHSSLDR